jgi:putative copper export protein
MTWYYYLNYRIYKYYQKKRDSTPAIFSFFGSALLLFMNIFSSIMIVDYFKPIFHLLSKFYIVVLMLILAAFNYLTLYRNKRFKEIFDGFDMNRQSYQKWDLSINIYFILTILLFLAVLIIADIRNH